ncbi:hypothetical protein ACLK15_14325 [Escherichia coli]
MVGSNGGLIQRSASPGGTTSVCPAKANVSPCPRHAPKILRIGKIHAFNGKTDRLQTFNQQSLAYCVIRTQGRAANKLLFDSITGHDIDYTSWKNC